MPQSDVELFCHIVFTVKDREPLLVGSLLTRTHQYIAGIIRNLKCVSIAVGGVADHVHILFQQNPNKTIPDLVRGIKSNSSRWIHETYPECSHFEWQDGYGAYSLSKTHIDAVAAYIRNQEQHHRNQSFDQEWDRLNN